MSKARRRVVRAAVAAALVFPLVVVASVPSYAGHATSADVANAKAKLDALNHQLEIVVEDYNQARTLLDQTKAKLADAKQQMQDAQAQAHAALAELSRRASEAYTGMGSQLDVLLGATDFTQFSDRLEYMGAMAQSDADLANVAEAARQKAEWATQQYDSAVTQAQTQLDAVNQKRSQISGMLNQAQTLYQQTNQDYQAYLAAQRAAAQRQQRQDTAGTGSGTGGGGSSSGGGGSGGGGTTPPPPTSSGAAGAVQAAQSVIGTQYVFGSADPSVGFDCSGLTMWSWGQVGVSLPHSSAMQYAVLPHVSSMSQALPGDLLFFYTPISHVAIYIGGGMMIHARHPGPGGQVQENSVSGYGTPVVGIARP
jgi:cell wall-associated NlpC family hydrolase